MQKANAGKQQRRGEDSNDEEDGSAEEGGEEENVKGKVHKCNVTCLEFVLIHDLLCSEGQGKREGRE